MNLGRTQGGNRVSSRVARSRIVLSLTAVLGAAVLAVPAPVAFAGGSPTDCFITNTSRSAPKPTFTDMAAAVDDAAAGEALTVRGRCEIGDILLDKNLSITGVRRTSPDSGPATLSGSLTSGHLLIVSGASVTVTGLKLSGGDASGGVPGGYGGAILVDGQTTPAAVVLKNAVVTGNTATVGGGVSGLGTVTITLSGTTKVKGNTATDGGAGVHVAGVSSKLILKDSAAITGNQTGSDGFGGGVYLDRAAMTMSGATKVNGNTSYLGGGIYAVGGALTVGGTAQINANTGRWGAAISVESQPPGMAIKLKGKATIANNVVTGENSSVIGLLNTQSGTTLSLLMEDSAAIKQNDAHTQAGTAIIFVRRGASATVTLTMTESSLVTLNKVGTGAAVWLYTTQCGIAPTISGVAPRTLSNTPNTPKILASSSSNYC